MVTFVALLRGINVGGSRSIAMADLRSSLTALGLSGVETYLQSGNAVFGALLDDPSGYARAIEERIDRDLGKQVEVLVLRGAELGEIVAANPFVGDPVVDETWLDATVLFRPASGPDSAALVLPAREGERATLVDRVAYLCLPHGYGRTKLNNAFFERALSTAATTRNWRTVRALADLVAAR
jgi:uncharacterized protein (DUF1697 family)